jgi:hypothetical protein
MPIFTSEALKHQDVPTTQANPGLDMFSPDIEFMVPSTPNGQSDHHIEGSGPGDNMEQILTACMSQGWAESCNHLHPQSEPDGDSDEIDSECDLDATAGDDGKTSMVPLEDELSSDESDVIGWDESDQQCSLTGCDESGLGEDFESRYAMIGALYFAFSWVFIMLIIFC